MGLLANGFRDKSGVYQTFGATASNNAYPSVLAANYARTGAIRNLTAGQGITDELVGLPYGNRHPSAWMMPQKGGALAARNTITGEGDASITMASGVNGEASLTGAGDLTGTGALIVSLVAALTGSGTITNASAIAFLQLAASLAGAGDLAGAATAIGHAAAALQGDGDASGTATALGTLAASIVVTGTGLSTANVGAAVWAQVIEAGYTAEQILRGLAAIGMGAATGLDGGDPQFTGLDGTTTRVDGALSGGTRTIDTLDLD